MSRTAPPTGPLPFLAAFLAFAVCSPVRSMPGGLPPAAPEAEEAAGLTPVVALPPDRGLALEETGAVIGEVVVRVGDVFDPEDPREDHQVYRLANRLHRTTRDNVIREQLLFKPGDRFSRRLLAESERLLRQDRYLYDVEIRPFRYRDGKVDVEVVTRDVWTLNVGGGFGRKGGEGSSHFEIQDTNLLGTGKSLTVQRAADVDRTSLLLRYDDPAVLGHRAKLGVGWSDNSDGTRRELDFGRPFFSLDSRWSAHLSAVDDDRVDSLYELGHVIDSFRHREQRFELRGGLSRGLVDGWARRWTAGLAWERDLFSPAAGFVAPSALPAERTLAYPWVALDLLQDRFEETRDLDQIRRTEDLHLGRQLHLRLGVSSPLLGATEAALVGDAAASIGWQPAADQTLLLSSEVTGRWGRQGAEGVLASGRARYYWRDFGEHALFATLEGDVARHLDPGEQLLLGGDSGPRGYPLRYQDGDARALLTLEQRFYTDLHPFQLFHVGAAAFFDAGRTWGGGASELGLLRDLGVGLRLSSSRSGLGSVVHLDLAFPLDGDPSIRRTQWLVTTRASF